MPINRSKNRINNFGFTPTARNQQTGFTIIELMIATTVFSLVLLICTFGLLQVSRVYYKGVTESRVQESLRNITDEISRAIQFSGQSVVPTPSSPIVPGNGYVFCIGDQHYSVVTDRQLVDGTPDVDQSQASHLLTVDALAGCNSSSPATFSGRELMSPNMRLAKLEIITDDDELYKIDVRIVYGANDLLNSDHSGCENVRAGTQFCASAELNTVVQKR